MGYIDNRTQNDFQELENEINAMLTDFYGMPHNMRDVGDNKQRYKDQTGQYLFTLWVIDKYHRLGKSKMGAIGEWFNRDRTTPNHWRDNGNIKMRKSEDFRGLYDNLKYLGTRYNTEGYLKAHGLKIRFIERQMEHLSTRREQLLKSYNELSKSNLTK
jgi:hypothetical protein